MQPSTPQLNIDWRLSPQQEQAMSVERGIDKISATINDVVRQKREEDKQYNDSLRDIISKTSGQYQQQMYDIIEQSREKLKAAGANGWKNSKELLSAREDVLRDLTFSSQKANYVSSRVPQIIDLINKDPYADKGKSIEVIQNELKKGIRDIDVTTIESVYSSPEYKDMTAVMRDALDKVVGDRMYTSDPVTRLEGDIYNMYQLQYKGNLKQIKKPDGKVDVVPSYNVYKADGSLDEVETRLKKLEFVDQVFDASGNKDAMMKYFDDYFTRINAPALRNVPESAGAAREKIVKELAADAMINTVGGYDYKYLGSREKDNYIGKQIAILNLKNSFVKQQINERAQEFYDLLKTAASSSDPESAKNIIKNRIETSVKGINEYIFAMSPEDGYYRLKGDKILTKEELRQRDQEAIIQYNKDLKRKKKGLVYPDLYFEDPKYLQLSKRAEKEGVKSFTGVAYTKGTDPLDREYVSFGFDWNDPEALSKFAVDWTNSTFDKNAATYEAVTGGSQNQGNQSGFTGGKVF